MFLVSFAAEKNMLVPGSFQLDFVALCIFLPFDKFQDQKLGKWLRSYHSDKIKALCGQLIFNQG